MAGKIRRRAITTSMLAALSGGLIVADLPNVRPGRPDEQAPERQLPSTPVEAAHIDALGAMPARVSGSLGDPDGQHARVPAALFPSEAASAEAVKADDLKPAFDAAASSPSRPAEPTPQTMRSAPLPVRRPPEFRRAIPDRVDRSAQARKTGVASQVVTRPPDDPRSFLEKLFNVGPMTGSPLAYAALGSRPVDVSPKGHLGPTLNPDAGGVAVYDIIARTVTLPNGEKLEAHSGLREKLDDPRFAHVPMQGSTPPGTYDLSEREKAFHGVRAIRLNPIGGANTIYGRVGLLAHTYLLGPNGDSNGCVSFRDYDRFLQAFLRGEVRRLVVVPGKGQSPVPGAIAESRGRSHVAGL